MCATPSKRCTFFFSFWRQLCNRVKIYDHLLHTNNFQSLIIGELHTVQRRHLDL